MSLITEIYSPLGSITETDTNTSPSTSSVAVAVTAISSPTVAEVTIPDLSTTGAVISLSLTSVIPVIQISASVGVPSSLYSVIDKYDITTEFSQLEVHKMWITLSIGKVIKTYNGRLHTAKNALVYVSHGEENMPEGYTIEAVISGEGTDPTDEPIVTRITSYKIFDAQGNDITDNYDVECVEGKLEIMKLKITIESDSATKEYDGTVLKAPGCKIISGKLVSGHRLDAKGIGKTSDGEVENKIEFAIYDSTGNDVTSFYDVTTKEGTLTVT